MPANVDGMVREGISAYRAGRKDEARALLLRAVEIDQFNEQAWLWLSAVVESVDEQRTCLENVLTINPNNERAKQGLQMLSQKSGSAVSSKSASAQADDVLASASFTATPPPPQANPFSADEDELPTTIEWDAPPPTASSSASSTRPVNEPSAAEYDDWVSNLNLGGNSANQASTLDAAAQFMSTPFDDDDDDLFASDPVASIEDDIFSSGPFSAPETPLPKRQPEAASRPASLPAARKGSDSLLDEIEEDEVAGSAFFDDDNDDDDNWFDLDKPEASEYFQYIPKEIKATRLPGTRERYPALVIVGLLVMLLLNVGAAALLVNNLTQ